MKISYKHIASCLHPRPKIKELSEKLFQLGHEHEVIDEIFDIELTQIEVIVFLWMDC